jgi:catechol 2,3-dioxygenase-like lactoylglutathione lyase family enzyme
VPAAADFDHITITVPDLRDSVEQVRALGADVTGEDYSQPSWQEAFIAPDGEHGVVIQLAESDTAYPSPAELLGTTDRDPASFPSSTGASDPTWWTPVWDTPAGPPAELGATHLASTDLARSRLLFQGVLGAAASEDVDGLTFRWPSGTVRVHSAAVPGVTALSLTVGPPGGLAIGPTPLQPPREGQPG